MILIQTLNPTLLLNRIYKAIDDGKIDTWEYTFYKNLKWTPSTGNWQLNAYFRPKAEEIDGEKYLSLRLKTFPNKSIRTEDFAAYHGHFAQMILTHFGSVKRIIHMHTIPVEGEDSVTIKDE